MVTISIQLPEDQAQRLGELANRLNIPVEELAKASIRELLTVPDERFEEAAQYVLKKNAELYRRLA